MSRIIWTIWLLAGCTQAQAQGNLTKELAEPFSVEVTLQKGVVVPQKGDVFGDFEVLDIQNQEPGAQMGSRKVSLVLIAYDTGTFRLSGIIPEIDTTRDLMIFIVSPPANLVQEYGPVKEIEVSPEEQTEHYSYLWLLLGLSGTSAALYLLLRKRISTPAHIAAAQGEHWQDALYRISDQWKKEQLSSVELGEGLIAVLHNRFGVPHKRSVRKLYKSIEKQLPSENGSNLKEILVQTDAWRFGKQVAGNAAGSRAIEVIRDLSGRREGAKKN